MIVEYNHECYSCEKKNKMDLTDNEKRDLIKLIENNQPLPENYRFKLFKKKDEIELIWNGKSYDITNVSLPFQIIEHVDEPREEKKIEIQGSLFDERGRQLKGWTNKLIWGNNSLVLSSLINGPLRKEIEEQGGLKLVYIDPPFDVGDDFEFEVEIGNKRISKKRNALEHLAFSDTWGEGSDSFLSMIYERLRLIKNLMANDASIYVHCDWRLNSYLKILIEDIFGSIEREIIWSVETSSGFKSIADNWIRGHDTIIYAINGKNKNFNKQFLPLDKKTIGRYDKTDNENRKYKVYYNKDGSERRVYLDRSKGKPLTDTWTDIISFQTINRGDEYLGYPTQKPEKLLERIIKASSNENDLVADFFCGSGTTLAVAEKLNRKWIGVDLGKFAIHTSKKRLINIQRDKKDSGNNYRAFEVLNVGKYQREFFFKDYLYEKRHIKNEGSENHYYSIVLSAYKAKPIDNLNILKGVKNNRFIAIGPFNLQVTRMFTEKVIDECVQKKITKVDILGFEFEMGLFPNIRDYAKTKNVDLNCLYIPNEVFDKNAIKKNQIIFYNTAYIDAEIIKKKKEFSVRLKGYSIFDSENLFEETLSGMRNGEKREILMNSSIIKVQKDKKGKISKQVIKMKWKNWIDYWSVDFDFQNKQEIIRDENNKEKWTGDYIFENEWQSFKSNDKKELEFETPPRPIKEGKKIGIKVIDIFGNDTMKILKI